jgi:hypothetical protein
MNRPTLSGLHFQVSPGKPLAYIAAIDLTLPVYPAAELRAASNALTLERPKRPLGDSQCMPN